MSDEHGLMWLAGAMISGGPQMVKMWLDWRKFNAEQTASKAKELLEKNGVDPAEVKAPPTVVYQIMDNASVTDDPELRNLWAGLLASSCTPDGKDQSNKVFVNMARQLTPSQVRFLNVVCDRVRKFAPPPHGLIFPAEQLTADVDDVKRLFGISDTHQLDIELDHLRQLGLVSDGSGIQVGRNVAIITPTPVALNLHVRALGVRSPASSFYPLSPAPEGVDLYPAEEEPQTSDVNGMPLQNRRLTFP